MLSVLVFLLAILALHGVLGDFTWNDVSAELSVLSSSSILLSIAAAFLSYLLLTLFDWIGSRLNSKPIPLPSLVQTAFIANALGHNLGMAALTGGAVRMRSYSAYGLSALEVGHIIATATFGFFLGGIFWLGLALSIESGYASQATHLQPAALQIIGPLLLIALAVLMLLLGLRKRPISLFNRSIHLPRLRDALVILWASTFELACAAAAMYFLLPDQAGISYLAFIGLYTIAVFAGVVSTVPAGLGVFEASMVVLLPNIPAHQVLATILAYRVIYYLMPLLLALLLLGLRGLREHSTFLKTSITITQRWTSPLVAPAFSLLVFAAGAALVLNGSLPLHLRSSATLVVPIALPLLEISHLAASALGVVLLILAHGINQRIRLAWWLSLASLFFGAVLMVVVGMRWTLAVALLLLIVPLWSARRRFYRQAALFDGAENGLWLRNVFLVIAASVWLGFLVHRNVAYANELWWQFAFSSDAPRMLRATLLSLLVLVVFGFMGLLRARKLPFAIASDAERDRAGIILLRYGGTDANLALLPDKHLLFSDNDDGFLMYQRSGKSLIAFGDPVCSPESQKSLAWRFRELADRNGLRTVFYQVSDVQLPTYLDMGLTLTKLGEEALVSLASFSLEGSSRAELRQEHRRAVREGAEFAVLTQAEVKENMPRLKVISDQWLENKQSAEKGFSLGYFDESYISRFYCAVVKHHGEIIAFANILTSANFQEISLDLMRYVEGGPKRTMDFLFIELMLWGKQAGYREFSLGMSPLSGMSAHELAPLWHKLAHFALRHGDRFYNFEGLRHYKEKYSPKWQPRYLASPSGLKMARSMFEVSRLIAGGTRQMFLH